MALVVDSLTLTLSLIITNWSRMVTGQQQQQKENKSERVQMPIISAAITHTHCRQTDERKKAPARSQKNLFADKPILAAISQLLSRQLSERGSRREREIPTSLAPLESLIHSLIHSLSSVSQPVKHSRSSTLCSLTLIFPALLSAPAPSRQWSHQ